MIEYGILPSKLEEIIRLYLPHCRIIYPLKYEGEYCRIRFDLADRCFLIGDIPQPPMQIDTINESDWGRAHIRIVKRKTNRKCNVCKQTFAKGDTYVERHEYPYNVDQQVYITQVKHYYCVDHGIDNIYCIPVSYDYTYKWR